jgi:regulator of protease activity HflC (stomatin/prohibitin superfamily)
MIMPFIERVNKYPIYWQTYSMVATYDEGDHMGMDSIRARTSDGQEVLMDCSLIFRIDSDQAVLVHIDWQDRYREDFVRPLTRSIVRRQVSQFTVEEVNSSSRRDLEANLDRLLREEFLSKGFVLDQFLLRDITFSPEYALSVEQKQVALEEQIRAEYEAERMRRLARGQADALIINATARAEALSLIGVVLAQNPDLLTYQYIDKLSPNIRAMLVPTDAPLILPLQKMLDATEAMSPTESMTDTVAPEDIEIDGVDENTPPPTAP